MGRLEDLGFKSYDDYLRSPHWRERRRIAGAAAKWTCACGARATQIHHRCYERLGRELEADLRAVCGPCHEKIHDWIGQGMALPDATDAVLDGIDPMPDYGRSMSKKARRRARKKAKDQRRAENRSLDAHLKARAARQKKTRSPESLEELRAKRASGQAERRASGKAQRRARNTAKQEFIPYRPDVGAGLPMKVVRADGTAERVRRESGAAVLPRRKKSTESSGPAGAPGVSLGSTDSPGRA